MTFTVVNFKCIRGGEGKKEIEGRDGEGERERLGAGPGKFEPE